MGIKYRKFTLNDAKKISAMMQEFNREDRQGKFLPDDYPKKTVEYLFDHPDQGLILIFENDAEIIGYAILINFWSNEFAGNVLNIDELYLEPEWRGQGIGTSFIQYLTEKKFNKAVMLQLEVTDENERARKLYESLGFASYKNETLTKMLN